MTFKDFMEYYEHLRGSKEELAMPAKVGANAEIGEESPPDLGSDQRTISKSSKKSTYVPDSLLKSIWNRFVQTIGA